MQIKFHIFRGNPSQKEVYQSYSLEVEPQTSILDCLNQIKWQQDGSLAFRKNCRNAICGSCAIRINDQPFLACKEKISNILEWLEKTNQTFDHQLTIKPLGNLPVIKDLVVDMTDFWRGLEAINPYLIRPASPQPEREFVQKPAERQSLDQVANCILCGACYSDCDARKKNQDFVGPHALAKVHRFVMDSRDTLASQRLEAQNNAGMKGVTGCNGCKMCNLSCPMGVAPMTQIETLRIRIFDLLDPL